MAEIVLFHHVQGATPGVHAFADALRDGGHTVHVPDLFDGALPESIEAGLALMAGLADHVVAERTARAAPTPRSPWPAPWTGGGPGRSRRASS